MLSKILLVGIAGLLIAQAVSSADRARKNQEPTIPTTQSEGVHIEYLCAGQRESIFSYESDKGIWLTLKNSSRRTVFVRTYRRPRTENPCSPNVRSEVGIDYDVVQKETYRSEEKEIKELPIERLKPETSIVVRVKPHRSIVFSVAREHLTPKRAIYVTFWYAPDKAVQSKKKRQELSRAYFYAFELPQTKLR
jgi:hypothetical protein